MSDRIAIECKNCKVTIAVIDPEAAGMFEWYCPHCNSYSGLPQELPQAKDLKGLFKDNPIDIQEWSKYVRE